MSKELSVKVSRLENIVGKLSKGQQDLVEAVVEIAKDKIEEVTDDKRLQQAQEMVAMRKELEQKFEAGISKLREDYETLRGIVCIFVNNKEGEYNKYKKIAKKRVFELVGKPGSNKYVLYYLKFIHRLHADVANILGYANTKVIPDEKIYIDRAKAIASKWKPEKQFAREKYNELFRLYDNNNLSAKQLIAFENHIEETNGGRNLGF